MTRNLETLAQLLLVVLSLWAILGTTSGRRAHRWWGSLAGLLSQPLWLYATWQAEQWGMFGLSALYTLLWIRGLRSNRRQFGADHIATAGPMPAIRTAFDYPPPRDPQPVRTILTCPESGLRQTWTPEQARAWAAGLVRP